MTELIEALNHLRQERVQQGATYYEARTLTQAINKLERWQALAQEASRTDTTSKDMRAARDELVREGL